MSARWLVVLFTAAALVATPIVLGARAAPPSDIAATDLAQRVQQSADVPWSGFVETSGTLQVPDNESFATLAQLLGENTQLRVWWRNTDDWRVDRIRSTGETDLFRQQGYTIRWVSNRRRQRIHLSPRFGCPMHPICCLRPWLGK